MENYQKEKEAIEAFLIEEFEDYGYTFDVDKDKEAEDFDYFPITPSKSNPDFINKSFNQVNMRVKELDEEEPHASKFEVEVCEDCWEDVVYYNYSIKHFHIALMWCP